MKKLNWKLSGVCLVIALIAMTSCTHETTTNTETSEHPAITDTTRVVIVVIDGPRYVDTWGTEGQPHIPYMADSLLPLGTFFSNFQNNRHTYTLAGHTALLTGNYQAMSNDGSEAPKDVSILHHYLQQTNGRRTKAALITSKSKLHILAQTKGAAWEKRLTPYANSGTNGEDRADVETFMEAVETLKTLKPNLLVVQFKGPDSEGHANNWEGYLENIKETDSLVFELWNYLQKDEKYKNRTALLVTNDHGRHVTGHKDGFASHGDSCEGCKHISLLALGPDFSKGRLVTEEYELVDIAPTVAALLHLNVDQFDNGQLITPLLERKKEEQILLDTQRKNDFIKVNSDPTSVQGR